jgi:uncharacterized protein (UPF0371 family)
MGRLMPCIDQSIVDTRYEVAVGFAKSKTVPTKSETSSAPLNAFYNSKEKNLDIIEKLKISPK